jgi:hypothetical protein
MRGAARHDRLVYAVAALFLCAHLAWLPGQLEDIDSINFALGLRAYDVAAHQPHPPGYPVFMVLARAVAALGTGDAMAMALLSGLAGAVALLLLYRVLRLIQCASPADDTSLPFFITTLTAATPLFWVTALRPLSDMSGLAAALGCQYLLLDAARPATPVRRAVVAAAACGVATGLRSQVTWLVVPLLVWLIVHVWKRDDVRAALGVAASAVAGVLTWAVPMVAMTGGVAAYRAALTSQAGEDFEGVPMLLLQPGLRRLAAALADSFVWPWGWWPLAAGMIGLALIGTLALRGRSRLATWLGLGYVPYLVYHLLLQETETTRYALPLVPLVTTLLVLALLRWTPRPGRLAAAVACGLALGVSLHAHQQYVGAGVTVSEVLQRMDDEARRSGTRPQVLMHRRVWAETRRARAAIVPTPSFDVLPAPRTHEWREAVGAWEKGARVWWLVDPHRGDRVAVDPHALHLRQHVGWPMPVASVLGGMRPHAFEWYDVATPQWVLGDGWRLTPELAGLSAAAGQGPTTTGATALVRASIGEATVVIGGRHVAPAGAPPVSMEVRLGPAWSQVVDVPPGAFAFTWRLPSQVVAAPGHLPLEVRTARAPAGAERLWLEQFDVQPVGTPVLALEHGWYEPERDVVTGRTWRWIADQSALRVVGATGDVRLVLAGRHPRHYARAPVLEIFAGTERIASHTLTRTFHVEQVVSARQLAGDGRLTWRVSPSFVAGERTGTADARRLALEIALLRVHAVR